MARPRYKVPAGATVVDDGGEWTFLAVAQDPFLSGWGLAPRRSLVAWPARTYGEAQALLTALRCRGDFVRLRIQKQIPRLHAGDHLHVYSAESARRLLRDWLPPAVRNTHENTHE